MVSGESIKDRPEFQRLLDQIKNGKYQAIVVKDLYRLGRGNYTDMGIVYDLIRDKRIFIITRDNVLDPANHDDLRKNIKGKHQPSREKLLKKSCFTWSRKPKNTSKSVSMAGYTVDF